MQTGGSNACKCIGVDGGNAVIKAYSCTYSPKAKYYQDGGFGCSVYICDKSFSTTAQLAFCIVC